MNAKLTAAFEQRYKIMIDEQYTLYTHIAALSVFSEYSCAVGIHVEWK